MKQTDEVSEKVNEHAEDIASARLSQWREGGEAGVESADQALLPSSHVASDGAVVVATGGCDCAPSPGGIRHALAQLVTSNWFNMMSLCVVLINMAVMTLPYEGMSEGYASLIEQASLTITWIFIAEMALKVLGLGCAGYWSDGWNQLDGAGCPQRKRPASPVMPCPSWSARVPPAHSDSVHPSVRPSVHPTCTLLSFLLYCQSRDPWPLPWP